MVGLALSQHSLLAQERIPARTGQSNIAALGHSELLCGSEEEKKKKRLKELRNVFTIGMCVYVCVGAQGCLCKCIYLYICMSFDVLLGL